MRTYMNKILHILITLCCFAVYGKAQTSVDMSGKVFQLIEKIPNSTTELKFKSNTEVTYVITNYIFGKTYIDECPGKSIINGNTITISCICKNKELYPDPISDRFTFDAKSRTLISTDHRTVDGIYFVWELK